jgi:hypothetical protein
MWQRTLALLAGMTLFCAVTTVSVASFWHVATWDMLGYWVVLAALMFAPVLLCLLRRVGKPVRAARVKLTLKWGRSAG